MCMFYYKIGLIKLQPIAKVNFKCIYLRTMVLYLQTYKLKMRQR